MAYTGRLRQTIENYRRYFKEVPRYSSLSAQVGDVIVFGADFQTIYVVERAKRLIVSGTQMTLANGGIQTAHFTQYDSQLYRRKIFRLEDSLCDEFLGNFHTD